MPDSTATPRLRCVHCHTTETPLWRTGPDGPRSLCNACGVRFKKGKLVLYKDDQGNLTAVKREDALPVHVPPPAKKSNKRTVPASSSPTAPSSPTESSNTTAPANSSSTTASSKRVVRKVPSESTIQQNVAIVGKKPRSRARRANAGQLPGRYASSQFSFDSNHAWRSPTDSPVSSPSSPAHSPRVSADRSTTLTTSSSIVTDEFSPHHRNSLSDEDHLFTDMASLGLDGSADPENHTLLQMPADPCSAEQFTFAFSGLGRDAYLAFDTPDRVGALRALLLDRSRKVSQRYEQTLTALCRLYEYRQQHRCDISPGTNVIMNGTTAGNSSSSAQGWANADDCKEFVRSFAQMDLICGFDSSLCGLCQPYEPGFGSEKCGEGKQSTVMLAEKTLHCAAVEKMRDLVDSSELVGFAETCLIELLADDFSVATCRRFFLDYDPSSGRCLQMADTALPQHKPVATPA